MTESVGIGSIVKVIKSRPEWGLAAAGTVFQVDGYAGPLKSGDPDYADPEVPQGAMYSGWGQGGTCEAQVDDTTVLLTAKEAAERKPPSRDEMLRFVADRLCDHR